MNRFALRWVINMIALYLAVGTDWIPGIHAENTTGWAILAMALVFTVVHTLLSPMLKLLTCSLIVLSMGLFVLLINTLLFWLTGWIGNLFTPAFGYTVDSFLAAFLGALLVSVVNFALSLVFREELKGQRTKKKT
ncbi:MAG: phage holin family protein [Anaerolineales bacterium]|nr:phage holin family protein [Anaerolineales bacterium]